MSVDCRLSVIFNIFFPFLTDFVGGEANLFLGGLRPPSPGPGLATVLPVVRVGQNKERSKVF